MFGRKHKRSPQPDGAELYAQARELKSHVDRAEKMRLLGRAADSGHAVSAFDLGVLYEKDHDLGNARRRYEQAESLGHPVAVKFLTALDDEESKLSATQRRLDDMRVLAEGEDPVAMRNYAWELRSNSRAAADEWFTRAADAGEVDDAELWTEQALQAGAEMGLPEFARPA